MSEYLCLLKRELKSIAKEKTIVFAILVEFFIASFSSVILTGIMVFYDPTSISESTRMTVTVGFVDYTGSPMPGYLRGKNIIVKSFPDLAAAEKAFQAGQVDTVMFIPEIRSGVVNMQLVLPKLDTKKTVILMVLDDPLKRYENYLREANGVQLRYRDIGGKPYTTFEFLYSMIIPILMLFPALIAGSIVIDTVSEELENKTFDTLLSAPVSLSQVFAAKVTAPVVTAIVQVLMWAGLLKLNGLVIQSPVHVLILTVIIAAGVSFGAAIIALYFKDRERAQYIYSLVLIVAVAGSYFLSPSPFSLITKLAAGVPNIGILEVAFYTAPVIAIGAVLFKVLKPLALARQ